VATVARSAGRQSTHDRVIALVAERWASPQEHNITTNPGSERNRWAGSDDRYPDLVGWARGNSGDVLRWVAEVETEESVTEAEARGQWRTYAAIGVPFYLVVPQGYGARSRELARAAGVGLTAVYEYAFANGIFQLTR
jgi:hypothetical protein